MSAFGWISAGHRTLLKPWLQRSGARKSAARKAVPGLESLEPIELLSHASAALALAQAREVKLLAAESAAQARAAAKAAAASGQVSTAIKIAPAAVTSTAPQTTALQTVTVPNTLTNFSQQFTPPISLFDPKLGTLVSVTVTEAATLSSTIVAENTSTSSSADITGELTGNVSITGFDNAFNGDIQVFTQTITAPPFTGSGTPDFTGPSTVTFPPLTQTQNQTLTFTQAADLAYFTASASRSTVSPTLVANAQSTATAPNGNLQSLVTTSGSGTITVQYQYIPAAPTVVKLVRFGIHQQPTVLQVNYGGFVDPTEATTASNYRVVLPNKFGSFTGPGVTYVAINSVTFNPVTNTASLVTARRLNFHKMALLQIALPSNNGNVINIQFGGINSLGGYLNHQGQFIQYIPGVTVLPSGK